MHRQLLVIKGGASFSARAWQTCAILGNYAPHKAQFSRPGAQTWGLDSRCTWRSQTSLSTMYNVQSLSARFSKHGHGGAPKGRNARPSRRSQARSGDCFRRTAGPTNAVFGRAGKTLPNRPAPPRGAGHCRAQFGKSQPARLEAPFGPAIGAGILAPKGRMASFASAPSQFLERPNSL